MNILGYEYQIIEDGDSDFIGAFGRKHAAKQIIQIAKGLVEQQRISTILHEIIEALNYHLELEMEHHKIMALEAGLYQTLTVNGVDLKPLLSHLDKA